ncbi:hypothetical protein EXU85_01935 [Spirosoma sp. KCTC 42546]|uniref:T9SS type A sorting domain-containing protein n=1 Tax=Spirosoma sp. KCTC 42546 TaxID=2520506 RepID=UPI001159C74A|nr:T9SS type A sorting domain-containing protein [Spirosoma sp. KCTC 42546]QDK77420.1 hypothetical protein EXU85_01935 [Spirosoma sp. KCTC 42546]
MLTKYTFLFPFLVVLSSFYNSFAQTPLSGSVAGTLTKANSPYVINSSVNIPTGQTLIIEPGVEIRSQYYYDNFTVNGTLIARGTATDSIRFVGIANPNYTPVSTHGGQLVFASGSANSVLDYVAMSRWGDRDFYSTTGAININAGVSSLTINNSSIHGSEGLGINISSSAVQVSNSLVTNSGNTGIRIDAVSINPVISSVVFAGNNKAIDTPASSVGGISNLTNADIQLRTDPTTTSCTIPKPGPGSYYMLNGGFSTGANTITTIDPGVEIRSHYYYDNITINGTLIARGTATDSIRFVGIANPNYTPVSTHGGQLVFASGSANSVLDYVAMSRWGDRDFYSTTGAININAGVSSLTINNSSIHGSEGLGMSISSSGVQVTNSSVINSGNTGIRIDAASISPVISSVVFMGNEKAIEAPASSVSGFSNLTNADIQLRADATGTSCTIPKPGPGSYYSFGNGGFTISANTVTTIQPGTEIRSKYYYDQVSIDGTLIAKGTATDSIRFVGIANPNYTSISTHGGRLSFSSGSANSVLDYVAMSRWGDRDYSSTTGAININAGVSSLTINNSSIHGSEGLGISISSSGVQVTNSSVTNSGNTGIRIDAASISPVISSVVFMGNEKAIEAPASSVSGFSNLTNADIQLRADATGTSCTIPKPGPGSYYSFGNGGFTISANTVTTIQPGTEIRSKYYYDQVSIDGTLIAKGTATDSIRFVGIANPNYTSISTHGGRLSFSSGSANSVLDYVAMSRWGDRDYSSTTGAININAGVSSLTINNSSIHGSEGLGISISSSGVQVTNSSVTNSGNTGIRIDAASISPVISSVVFMGNEKAIEASVSSVGGLSNLTNADIQLRPTSTDISCAIPKPGPGSYYMLNGGFAISANTVTTIQAGTEIRSRYYYDNIAVSGTLIARGTATDSIRFVGFANPAVSSAATHGGQLSFDNNSTNSVLEYVSMDRWGESSFNANNAALVSNTSSLSVLNSSVLNSEGAGIRIESASVSPVISGVTFAANGRAIDAPPSSVGGFSNLTNADIQLRPTSTDISCTIPKPGPGSYYMLNGGFAISANTVTTIQAGTEIRSRYYYDNIAVSGTLIARGTATDSIRFVGFANPAVSSAATHGGQLSFDNNSTNSVLEYVSMDRWGESSFNANNAALVSNTSSLSVLNSSVLNSEGAGIRIESASVSPVISGVTFAANGRAIDAPPSSVGGFSNLTNADIQLRPTSTDISCAIPKPGPGSYYMLNGGFAISANTVTTIQAGTEIRSRYYYDNIAVSGTLIARGTATDSIRFVGFANPAVSSAATHGGQLSFDNNSTNSVLEYVSMDRWGESSFNANNAALVSNTSSLSVLNSSVLNSEGAGIRIESASVSPVISGVTFAANGRAIDAPPSSVGGFSNLTNADIQLRNNDIGTNCTIPKSGPGSYYMLNGGFAISANAVATIQPGVEIRSKYYYDQIFVFGTLISKGTATDSIRFLGFANPGMGSSATHGGKLYFDNNSTNSELEYVIMDRWGEASFSSPGAALINNTSSIRISKSTIRNSEENGIYNNAASPTITSSTIYGNATGIANIAGKPILQSNKIYSNSNYGIINAGSDTLDARSTYWGTPTGPLHPTLNPTGTGNRVSDKVLFVPWIEQLIQVEQSVNLPAIADKYVDEPVVLNATATSGLPVSFTITTTPASGVATLSGDTITFQGTVGQVTVVASQAGNEYFKPAEAQRTFSVSKRSQSIFFTTVSPKTFGDAPFSLTATATSGLPVTFSVVSGPATVNGDTLTLTAAGTVLVEARQVGNNVYDPANSIQQSFVVYERLPDLAVKNVSSDKTVVGLGDTITVSWDIANDGIAASPINWTERIYVQSPSGSNRTLIKEVTYATSSSLAIGQRITRSSTVSIPSHLLVGDEAVFVVEVIPGPTVQEMPGTQANNIAVQPTAWTIQKGLLLSLSASEITEGNSSGISATVSRTGSVSAELTVTVSLTNSARLSYPTSVVIPAGYSSISFTISAPDNTTVEGPITDQVQVSASGYQGAQAGLLIIDNDLPSLSITNLPASSVEGDTVKFRLATNLAPTSPLTVFLQSSSPTRFPAPASVTIAAGALYVDVPVILEQDEIPELDLDVTLAAGAANHSPDSKTIVITDDDFPHLELVLQTNTISESGGLNATQATLRRTASSNSLAFTANLSASLPNTLILPGAISLAAGENEKTFTIGVVDNTAVDGARLVTINASLFVSSCGCNAPPTSSGSVSATLTVNDDDGPSLVLTASQQTLPEGLANAGSLRITRNTATTDALSVTLTSSDLTEATVPATVEIPAGQSFVDVIITTLDDSTTDGNQQVYFTATAPGFSPGSTWVIVTDLNKPDLQIPTVQVASNTVPASATVNYQVSIKNTGSATAPGGTLIRGYLSVDNTIDGSDVLVYDNLFGEAIPAGQTKVLANSFKAPDAPGVYKLLFWVNPTATLTELLFTNNVSEPASLTVEPAYTASALVGPTYFLQGNSVSITGTATRSNGSTVANSPVEVYVITKGIRRKVLTLTDASGNYSVQFAPLSSESGHYVVGASSPGLNQTTEQDAFDVLGVRINGGTTAQFKVTLNEPLTGSLSLENLSDKSLTNFTLAPVTLPNGASIQFATLPTLAGNASTNIGYTVTGSVLTSGNSFETARFQAKSDEGVIQNTNIYYYCQAANGYLVANVSAIQASVSQSSGERRVEIKLVNKGKGVTGNITISLPQANWLSSVTAKNLPSLAPGDSTSVILKFLALDEVPFNYPIGGSIGINSTNGNTFSIPFTFQRVSESAGTARITVTDQFTYYTEGGPKVEGALVKITNYFTGEVYAQGYSDATGVFLATNVPEGKHRITVEKEKHTSYSNVLEINPGSTVESTVFLNYQAITFSWTVVPTAVQDQYTVVLEAKFETNVPAPVVTMEMPKTMPHLATGQDYLFNIVLTNHGLIAAQQVTLKLPTTDPEYEFITNYTPADLLANQSIQIPVIMRRRSGAASPGPNEAPCVDFVGVSYSYKLNATTSLGDKTGASFIYEGRNCEPGPAPVVVEGTVTPAQYSALYDAWSSGIASIEASGGDAPCVNCGSTGSSEGTAGSTPVIEQQKTSCVACIADISNAITACTPAGNTTSILPCYTSVSLDGATHDKGRGLLKCAGNEAVALLSGKVPGTGQVLCVTGVISAIETCKNAEGNLPYAVFNEISGNLQMVVNGYTALNNWMIQYFGDLITKEGWTALFPLVSTYLNDQTPIPAMAQSNIIAAMAGYDIQSSALTAFFTRWNTSLEAKAQNVFAPNSTYPNIINWNLVDGYVATLIEAHNHAVSRNFKTIDDMHKESIKSLNTIIDGQKTDVCASVSVQFSQKVTMTREAFLGTLEIFNGHPTDAMKMIAVNLQITDANGTPSNGLFEIQTQGFTNLSDVTGTGQISAQQKGSVRYLFIPESGAAPQTPKVYKFGGSVTYFDPYANAMVTMPLIPVPITVNPSPSLMLHYFMQRNILGDDALTSPDVEPSIPAELAVMIENKGYGQATNVTISSAKPKVVDNVQGLAIDFNLVGTKFNGQSQSLSLTDIPFGTIPALETRVGEWYFTSTLLGKFVSYTSNVVHDNSYGNSKLSLIQGVQLHELTKSIHLYGEHEDGINDFLVNDIFDVNDQPDIIYFSQGNRTAKVTTASGGNFSSLVSAPSFTNTLTVTPSDTGFNYIKLDDPGNRLYELVSVTRSDGQVIPLDNAWLTFVTLPVARSPIYENKFHIVDRFTSAGPATYTVVWKPVNANVPKVDSITGAPVQSVSTPVNNLKVYFSKPINPATFTYEDLSLSFQGGPNIANSSVIITQIDPTTFNVDLSAITTGNGNYIFTVQAAAIEDIYGISGTVGKNVSWSQFLGVPIVEAFQGIPANHMASAYSTVKLLFNLPIDVTTVTPPRFAIYKNGVLQAGSLTIDSVSADHKLFKLSGLQTILTQNGAYELRVDLPNIKSEDRIPGLQTQSVTLTVDNAGPVVLLLEKSTEGALDSQHIPFVNIKFDEGVVGLNTSAFQLLRNGQLVPITSTQLIYRDAKNWTAGNFGLLTYPEGNYIFSVNLGSVIDSTGNAGVGTQQISWVVSRSSTISFTGLASSYCSNAASQTLVGAPSGGVFSGPGITGNSFDPAVAGAGTHTITYTKDGQPVSQTTTVYALPELVINPGSTTLTCANPTVTLSAVGSGSLVWATGQTTSSISVSATGTYSVTLTSANGCTNMVSTTVLSDQTTPALSLSPTDATLTCSSPAVSVSAIGTGSVVWSTGQTTPSISVSTAGTYSLTLTGINGCTATASTVIGGGSDLVIASILPGSTTLTCASPITSLTASGGGTYKWSTGATTAVITVSPTVTTTYSVTVTSPNGCTSVASQLIAVDKTPPPASLIASQSTLNCTIPSSSLTASGGVSYWWSTGETSETVNVSPTTTTTYSVTVTGANGCTAVATRTISVNQTPPVATITASQTVLNCTNASASLVASGGVSYRWSTGETTATISVTPTTATTYSVTVTGATGCLAVATRSISVDQTPPTPVIAANRTRVDCTSPTASLTVSGGSSYRWSTGATTSSITVSPATTTTYSVTARGANGCTAVTTQLIEVDKTAPVASLVASQTALTCASPTVSLSASGGVSYRWSTGDTTETVDVSPLNTTTYSVTVTGANGCSLQLKRSISVNRTSPSVTLVGGTVANCTNPVVRIKVVAEGSYLWSTGETTDLISVTPTTTTTYSVTVTGATGCTTVATRSITVDQTPPTPVIAANRTRVDCTSPTASLTVSGGSSYRWSTGATTSSITVSPATTTTYSVTARGANGCTAVTTQLIEVDKTAPVASLVASQTALTCASPTVSLSASGGVSYRWSTGDTTETVDVSPLNTTTYSVTVTGANGCSLQLKRSISVNRTSPSVTLVGGTVANCTNPVVRIKVVAEGSYLWSTGETTDLISVTPTTTTTYSVTVTGATGCTTVATRSITVDQTPPTPVIAANRTRVDCTSPTASLTVSGGSSYRWSTGATTSSITVRPTTTTTYSVTARGANGCTAVTTQLIEVEKIAPIASVIASASVCEGASYDLLATTTGGTAPYTYVWSVPGTQASTLPISTSGLSLTTTTTRTYSVTAIGANGCVSNKASFVLTINPSAKLTQQPVSGSAVCMGTNVVASVLAVGRNLTYAWMKSGSTTVLSTSRTLTLPSVTVANEGSYYVVVSSDCGSVSSNLFTLTINPATQLITQPASATVAVGQSFTTSVEASGSSLRYQWYYGGNTPLNDQTSATLTIAGVTPANAGLYTCRVSGLCGSVMSLNARLTISSPQSRLGAGEPVNPLAFTVSTYPNPTSDKVIVRVRGGGEQPTVQLQLYDVLTNKLGDWVIGLENGQGETTLELGSLPAGIYLLEVRGDREKLVKRIQKQ